MIDVNNLVREYKIAKRGGGLLKYIFKREYEIKKAVDGISFNISKGDLVGYIGANGSGKSTTIKMLTGILVPTSGSVKVFGKQPHISRIENAARIGVVFGQRSQLWWDLPMSDSLDLLRRIYKVPTDIYKRNVKEFMDILDLGSFLNTPVRQLSLGQRMRADIAASLIHSPEILFLDEPTIGLDVVVKKQIRLFIKRMREEREMTVILTTHDMKDIEEICERMILIDKGKKVMDMKISEVLNKFGNEKALVVDFDEIVNDIIDIPNSRIIPKSETKWEILFKSNEISASEIIKRVSNISSVRDITIVEPDIEEIVRDIYSGKIVL